jgi:hypothetical protein
MRQVDLAHPCGKGSVLALPGVTQRYPMQPGATAHAIWKNEPTARASSRPPRRSPMSLNVTFCHPCAADFISDPPVDTGLRQLTPVDAGLPAHVIWQNEPTGTFSAVTSGLAIV